jgi:uncharacterized membrane protein YccC
MLPMIVAVALYKTTYLVTLGQGAFFFSTMFLPKKTGERIVMGSIVVALGLGFYLIGGSVAQHAWVAVLFTFLVCLNLSFLSNWRTGGPLALTFVMIFTAGLNTGSPQKASANFLAFAFVMGWSALISLLPIWQPIPMPPVNTERASGELAEQGFRIGIGASLALAVSYMFGFEKLGWAPSAVGNVVRYDEALSRRRAWARFFGTIGGAVLASIALAFFESVTIIVLVGALFAVLNGLFKKTRIGMMPLFYTATILVLYSANDLSVGRLVTLQRVGYNLIGITIGMIVIMYPFSRLVEVLNPKAKVQ